MEGRAEASEGWQVAVDRSRLESGRESVGHQPSKLRVAGSNPSSPATLKFLAKSSATTAFSRTSAVWLNALWTTNVDTDKANILPLTVQPPQFIRRATVMRVQTTRAVEPNQCKAASVFLPADPNLARRRSPHCARRRHWKADLRQDRPDGVRHGPRRAGEPRWRGDGPK